VPSLHRIHVTVEGIEHLEARHLRATVSSWLEDDDEHHRNAKPFTLTPLHVSEHGTAFDVALLDDRLQERLHAGVDAAARRPVHAGRALIRTVGGRDGAPSTLVQMQSWENLRGALASPTVTLRLLTPTVFRQGRNEQIPFPLPGLVFGHHRARWNAFCPPEHQMTLDLSGLWLHVDAFEGRSDVHLDGHRSGPHRHGHRPVRDVTFTGFVGSVTFRSDSHTAAQRIDPLRDWQTLARFATYCGTGANTTIGMGVTRWQP
jgi:CRISPR-associated endoribonuclease Cas6